MAKELKYTSEIADNRTIQAWHVSQSIEALTGQDAYEITISGSLGVTGSLSNPTISESTNTTFKTVMVNTTTGEFHYTGSYGGGGGGGGGTAGTSGTNGTSGTDGTSGTNGTSGSSGTSGAQGLTGANGTPGGDGTDGSSGVSGTSGINGTDGTSGVSGTSGSSGTSSDGTSGTIVQVLLAHLVLQV